MTYAELYELYKETSWVDDMFGVFAKAHVEDHFKAMYEEALEAVHKRVFPRRRKIQYDNIPTEEAKPVREWMQEVALIWFDVQMWKHLVAKLQMGRMAPYVYLKSTHPEMTLLRECSTSTYRSQGWGAHKYARAGIDRDVEKLQEAGFEAEVRTRKPFEDSDLTYYQCWSNAEPWQLDCLGRQDTLFDECVKLWKKGTNPAVIYPMLDPDIMERSCDVAMEV